MKRTSNPLRVVAWILAVSLAVQDAAMAADGLLSARFSASEPLRSAQLPEAIGTVSDAYTGAPGRPAFYLLEDAHTNESAERNIAQALGHLFRREDDLRFIFVEAGSGDVSLSELRRYGDVELRRGLAERYLKRGLLHAAEYFDLVSDEQFSIWGVEDFDLYRRALQSYRRTVELREASTAFMARTEQALDAIRRRDGSPVLQEIASLRRKEFKNGNFLPYIERLWDEADRLKIQKTNFPGLSGLDGLRRLERSVDFERAAREQMQAFESLPETTRSEILAGIRQPSEKKPARDASGRAFVEKLRERLGSDFSRYPELEKYARYADAAQKLHIPGALDEISRLEKEVFERLFSSDVERRLWECERTVETLRDLFNLKLSVEGYRFLNRQDPSVLLDQTAGFLNRRIAENGEGFDRTLFRDSKAEEAVAEALRFYALTFDRDEHFLAESLRKLRDVNSDRAVLIAGGYHSENLRRLMRARGLSYVTIRPQIDTQTNHGRYERLLLGQSLPAAAVDAAPGHMDLTYLAMGGIRGENGRPVVDELRDDAKALGPAISVGARLSAEDKASGARFSLSPRGLARLLAVGVFFFMPAISQGAEFIKQGGKLIVKFQPGDTWGHVVEKIRVVYKAVAPQQYASSPYKGRFWGADGAVRHSWDSIQAFADRMFGFIRGDEQIELTSLLDKMPIPDAVQNALVSGQIPTTPPAAATLPTPGIPKPNLVMETIHPLWSYIRDNPWETALIAFGTALAVYLAYRLFKLWRGRNRTADDIAEKDLIPAAPLQSVQGGANGPAVERFEEREAPEEGGEASEGVGTAVAPPASVPFVPQGAHATVDSEDAEDARGSEDSEDIGDRVRGAKTDESTAAASVSGRMETKPTENGQIRVSVVPNDPSQGEPIVVEYTAEELPVRLVTRYGEFYIERDKSLSPGSETTQADVEISESIGEDMRSRAVSAVSPEAPQAPQSASKKKGSDRGPPPSRNEIYGIHAYVRKEARNGKGVPVTIKRVRHAENRIKRGQASMNIAIAQGEGHNIIHNTLTIMQELATSRPDSNVLLIMDPSWLVHTNGQTLVKKAVVLENPENNDHYKFALLEFDEPQVIDYVAVRSEDYFPHAGSTVPVSESVTFEGLAKNKIVADYLMRKEGVDTPESVSLIHPEDPARPIYAKMQADGLPSGTEFAFLEPSQDEAAFRAQLVVQIAQFRKKHRSLVAKSATGSQGTWVIVFDETATDEEVADRILGPRRNLFHTTKTRFNAVTLQERLLPPFIKDASDPAGAPLDWNFRILVSRDENNELEAGAITVRVGEAGTVINLSKGSGAVTFDVLADLLGLTGTKRSEFRRAVEDISVDAVRAVEKEVKRRGTDGVNEQIDFSGVDVMVRQASDGTLVPSVIEVNGRNSGGLWHLDEYFLATGNSGRRGETVQLFADTMMRRAQGHQEESQRNTRDGSAKGIRGIRRRFGDLPALLIPVSTKMVVETEQQKPVIVFIQDPQKPVIDMALAALKAGPEYADRDIVVVPGKNYLLFEKDGVYATGGIRNNNGKIELVHYKSPVRVAYVYNLGSKDTDVDFVEMGVPVVRNRRFEFFAHHKAATAMILDDAGVQAPKSFTFLLPTDTSKMVQRDAENNGTRSMMLRGDLNKHEQAIQDKVKELEAAGMFAQGAVIKPVSGFGGKGVQVMHQASADEIAAEVIRRLKTGEIVMVQSLIVISPLIVEGENRNWNYRVFVTRDDNNQPVVMDALGVSSPQGRITDLSNDILVFTFEELSALRGVNAAEEMQKIREIAVKAFQALQNTAGGNQQDFAGIDIMADQDGRLNVIEVNGRRSGWFLELDQKKGGVSHTVAPLVRLMNRRADEYVRSRRDDNTGASPVIQTPAPILNEPPPQRPAPSPEEFLRGVETHLDLAVNGSDLEQAIDDVEARLNLEAERLPLNQDEQAQWRSEAWRLIEQARARILSARQAPAAEQDLVRDAPQPKLSATEPSPDVFREAPAPSPTPEETIGQQRLRRVLEILAEDTPMRRAQLARFVSGYLDEAQAAEFVNAVYALPEASRRMQRIVEWNAPHEPTASQWSNYPEWVAYGLLNNFLTEEQEFEREATLKNLALRQEALFAPAEWDRLAREVAAMSPGGFDFIESEIETARAEGYFRRTPPHPLTRTYAQVEALGDRYSASLASPEFLKLRDRQLAFMGDVLTAARELRKAESARGAAAGARLASSDLREKISVFLAGLAVSFSLATPQALAMDFGAPMSPAVGIVEVWKEGGAVVAESEQTGRMTEGFRTPAASGARMSETAPPTRAGLSDAVLELNEKDQALRALLADPALAGEGKVVERVHLNLFSDDALVVLAGLVRKGRKEGELANTIFVLTGTAADVDRALKLPGVGDALLKQKPADYADAPEVDLLAASADPTQGWNLPFADNSIKETGVISGALLIFAAKVGRLDPNAPIPDSVVGAYKMISGTDVTRETVQQILRGLASSSVRLAHPLKPLLGARLSEVVRIYRLMARQFAQSA